MSLSQIEENRHVFVDGRVIWEHSKIFGESNIDSWTCVKCEDLDDTLGNVSTYELALERFGYALEQKNVWLFRDFSVI